jgi:hypothetical protein
MTRIVRIAYRYKRPPRKRKPVVIEGPAVVTTASKRRMAAAEAKAALAESIKLAPAELATSSGAAAKSAIVTVHRPGRRFADVPDMTPEEYRHRGDAADALWRELVRRVRNP